MLRGLKRGRRKGRARHTAAALALCMLLAVLCAGCGKDEAADKAENNSTVVFEYGDNIVTLGEVYIYVCTVQEKYELQYGEDVWQLSLPDSGEGSESVSMAELTREAVVNEIIKVKTMSAHAADYNIKLSDAEIDELKGKAEEFYNGLTDEDIRRMELTEDRIYQVLYENRLSDMVEACILEDNPVEVSDEEARMTTFYDMYFACYSIDANGNVRAFSEEERKQQHENALQACSTLVTAGIDEDENAEQIEKLAEYYQLEQAKEQTLSPEDILETYGEDIYNTLYEMNNGDYSTVIESEYGYHVFQMIFLTDRKATDAKKERMTEEQTAIRLSTKLDEWKKEIDADFVYPDSVNMELYDTIGNNQ